MAIDSGTKEQPHKEHRSRQSGAKADKKKKPDASQNGKKPNPKAFACQSAGKAKRLQSRTVEKQQRRLHVPTIDRSYGEPAPYVVLVHGPPKVGKSLLIKSLVKHYTKHNLPDVRGPITIVSGKQRRVQFVECPNDINGMIDAAKFADLALLLIDGSYGFEMETFEFLNILQVHGFPKVMGVLTHLDKFKDVKKLRKTKQHLKHRFWTEIYDGAKLFYLSGLIHGKYVKREVHNLARFISVMKFHPLSWRTAHPYVLVDRFEDVTPPEKVRLNNKCDRNVTLYGYLRGCNMRKGTKIHIAGVGDYSLAGMTGLADPCPLPSAAKKKGLRDKEKLFYAPMSGLGDLLYDKDAVYININDHFVQFSNLDEKGEATKQGNPQDVGVALVKSLQNTKYSVDEKLEESFINLFSRKPNLLLSAHSDGIDIDESREQNLMIEPVEEYQSGEAVKGDGSAEESDAEDSDGSESESLYKNEAAPKDASDATLKDHLKEHVEIHDGRSRRKVIFRNDLDHNNMEDSAEEAEEEGDDDDDDNDDNNNDVDNQGSSGSESSAEDEDVHETDDETGNIAKWKESLVERAFSRQTINLMQLVYGKSTSLPTTSSNEDHDSSSADDESDEDDDFFVPKGEGNKKHRGIESGNWDVEDCSKFTNYSNLKDWKEEKLREGICDRFVTGDWSKASQRNQPTEAKVEDDDDLYGDFEDLETGEKHGGNNSDDASNGADHKEDSAKEERRLKKLALRAKFDAQFDGAEASEEELDNKPEGKFGRDQPKESDYFDKLKDEIELRKQMNIAELNELDEATQLEVEGFRTGTYLRLEVHDVPYEMVEYFDPCHPILVGGIGLGEENVGHMQVRLKRHRWHKKVLKNNDPLIVSIGWRRYQTIPVYAIEDRNGRHRMLKYTPEHMHCLAMFWGPLAPPNTGVVAFQNLSNNQDAKKGVLFIDFPPVLQLQLKRFEYDFMRDTMVKINDRYEFPLQLDLDRENGKYLSPEADRSVRNLYTLHSVLVHSGGVHGGHYYAFIRPTLSDQWYKFDDERVTKEDIKRALEEQYGGEEELPQTNPGFNNTPFKFTKYSNAYMLVYIRESDRDKIICNVDEKDIAEHLRERLKKEQEEKEHKKKEKAEAHLYTIIKVARDENLMEQIGKDIYFDLVDHDKVRSFRIQKQTPFNIFKEEVAKEFGIPVQFQRFWLWAKRQNHTYRPNRPLTPMEETQSVGQLREVSNKVHNAELKLFLEVELGPDLHHIAPPDKTKDDILLFFKLYDPEKEELRYVGRLFVKSTGKAAEILSKLNEMAGYDPEEEIDLYEEIKFEPTVMCEPIDKKFIFRACQLEDGDIVCFQKPTSVESEHLRYPDVPSFLEYVRNRQVVHFRSLEKPKEDDFSLELSKLHTYDDVVERVAQQLGLDDPSKLRLTPHNCYSQQPKPQPIKYRGVDHLTDMLVHYNQTSDILYYEVLDIPLPELQGLKTLKVAFHLATKEEVVVHTIRLPKQSTVGDVINDLKTKVELSHPDAELRLLEVFYHKIYKVFPHSEKIENINDQYWTLRAEEVPEEEKNLGPNDRVIHVYHFTKDTAQNQMQIQNFGEPFFLVIHEGETLAEVKARVQKKLQVADEEFAKWKFAFLSLGRPEYLQDSDIVSSRFQRRDVYGAWEQYLGLEHCDSAPKRSYAANQNRHTFEKPVKIYN